MVQERQEQRRVRPLPGTDEDRKGAPSPVDDVMDLRGQATTGPSDGVIGRFGAGILVIRQIPL